MLRSQQHAYRTEVISPSRPVELYQGQAHPKELVAESENSQ